MSAEPRTLTIMMTRGIDHELSSVGMTIANGAITAGLQVSIFLTSAAVDLVRRRGTELTQVAPLEPLSKLIHDFMARGGVIWACPPCVKTRGYEEKDLIEGVTIVGASKMLELVKNGGATLSF